MHDASTRGLELSREAASVAAFRMVVAFSAFGVADLVGAIGRALVVAVVPPPVLDGFAPATALATAWGAACVVTVLVASALKVALLVAIHRRRLAPVDPLALWVGIGVGGLGAHFGAAIVGYVLTMWLARTHESRALAGWSAASSGAAFVGMMVDLVLGVVIVAIAASAVVRDRRPAEPKETYRSPGAV